MRTKLKSLKYVPPEDNLAKVTMEIRGHPTEALNHGHRLAREILGAHRWRITYLHFTAPDFTDLASNGTLYLEAVAIV